MSSADPAATSPADASVQIVPAADLVDLRQRLLRPTQPREQSVYDGDHDSTTLHFGIRGATDGRTVVACATFLRIPFHDEPAWRLRGMAVDPTLQRAGFGGRILREAELVLRVQDHSPLLWCYARTVARGFYERNGWSIVGDGTILDFGEVGPHVEMIKRLA